MFQPGTITSSTAVLGGCSFHGQVYDSATDGHYLYLYVPYPTDAISNGTSTYNCNWYNGGSVAGASTITTSHEYAETVTDWGPGGGWQTKDSAEVADLCEGYNSASSVQGFLVTPNMFVGPGGEPVEPLWSNAANGCVFP
jgi:hypothetical protein